MAEVVGRHKPVHFKLSGVPVRTDGKMGFVTNRFGDLGDEGDPDDETPGAVVLAFPFEFTVHPDPKSPKVYAKLLHPEGKKKNARIR